MRNRDSESQRGFSLIELMIAMVITLIVSGAIYGLIAGGGSSFRREPEASDRQQNVRVALDMIMRDVANAGSGMPAFMQTFTQNLDGPGGLGAPMGLGGQVTDELEIITNDDSRNNELICTSPGNATSGNIFLYLGATGVQPDVPVMIVFADGTWTFRNPVGGADSTNKSGSGDCVANNVHAKLNFNQGQDASGMNTPAGVCQPSATGLGNAGSGTNGCPASPQANQPCCDAVYISHADIVHYRIRYDNGNTATGVPMLQRSSSTDPLAGFQTVARGIDDLQVRYSQQPPAALVDGAPPVLANNYGSIITEVEVRLSARSERRGLQGESADASQAVRKLRGSLTSTGSPRAALVALTQQAANPLWK